MATNNDLQPLLDTQQNHLNLVMSASDSLDSKNLALLALNVAVLVFIAQQQLSVHPALAAVLIASYVLALLLNVALIWPLGYIGASVDIRDHPEYLRMTKKDLLLQLVADTQNAITNNARLNNKKLRYCIISLGLSMFGTLVLISCILIV